MPSRRAFLRQSALAALATGCAPGSPGAGSTRSTPDTASGELDQPVITPLPEEEIAPITSNDAFYSVSITGAPSDEELAGWSLTIQTLAGDTVELTVEDLRALGAETFERTLMCIGSGSGAQISNATWEGVRLDAVLAAFGMEADAEWLWLEGYGGYATCVPATDIAAGLRLVFGMNGEDLPSFHGGPLRVLTPGRYGMKNPKWLSRIAFSATYIDGFWEGYGWSDTAVNHLQSWFMQPLYDSTVDVGPITLLGCAFYGLIGVAKVELSLDNGGTWSEAEITYAGGPDVWTLWRVVVDLQPGTYLLMLRATGLDGTLQLNVDAETGDDARDGRDAWQTLTLTVV